MTEQEKDDPPVEVSLGYPAHQLARALATANEHPDLHKRARAVEKAASWARVFEGMLDGTLNVGSRSPLAGVPIWATPKVVTGGFVTGDLLAGGPLQDHETAAQRAHDVPEPVRAHLHRAALTDPGIAELQAQLQSGHYRVGVPEEGALLAVAWLLGAGDRDRARAILDEIGAHFSTLRFYPIPADGPPPEGPAVHRATVKDVRKKLLSVVPQARIERQREAVEHWGPLYDKMIAIFAETVVGELPKLALDPKGKPARGPGGNYTIEGGWPCQTYPDGWIERARALLRAYRALARHRRLGGRHLRASDARYRIRAYLERAVSDPRALTGRDVGAIRLIVARSLSVHGAPESDQRRAFRARQLADVSGPSHPAIGALLAERLRRMPEDEGLDEPDAFLSNASEEEELRFRVPAGTPIPVPLADRVFRAFRATVEELVERGLITSGDTLATLLPQVTSEIAAAGFSDPALRRLYASLYRAFRRRRSLLLVNLAHQVRFDELPWVAALEAHRRTDQSEKEQSLDALRRAALLALGAFPEAIVPNTLLQEFRSLARQAGRPIDFVDEVAADIFMGTFSAKFVRAAQEAGRLLQGTIYANYYGIDYEAVLSIDDLRESKYGPSTSPRFDALCRKRALRGTGRGVAANGVVIEQQQILTTQNLASLVAGLGIEALLAPRARELAERCFRFVARRNCRKLSGYARLRMLKNTAYAFRQMLFWLSIAEDAEDFVPWARSLLAEEHSEFAVRFAPVLFDVEAAKTTRLEVHRAHQFLGWTFGPHWLAA
ncbi:MAG: hypothetical protein AAGF12_21330 [Myxococcota bacterium]